MKRTSYQNGSVVRKKRKLGPDVWVYHAFRHFNVSLMDALRVPLKTIQERIGHALTGSFTLDVYGHTLDWKYNEDAAKGLGEEIAHAVESHQQEHISFDSGHLTAHQKNTSKLRIWKSLKVRKLFGCGGRI
jgi:hypothetical protein